jgi:CheY-like chemotaxis protein
MPKGMDGVTLAQEARRRRPGMHVLLTSGYAREALERWHTLASDVQFVAKPYRAPDVAERLRMAMRRPEVQ